MKVLQITSSANAGSHSRIADEIGEILIEGGHESYIAYGRNANKSKSTLIKIGNKVDLNLHLIKTRLFDLHGFGSKNATKLFIKEVVKINPDIIHLHNLHGYYLNVEVLFKYLKDTKKPVVWTFHDCWPFTGHCSYFDSVNCLKWKAGCDNCPIIHCYPKSWFFDNSRKNYRNKKELFNGLRNLVVVSPSEWLASHLRNSFFSDYEIRVINNWVDLKKFRPINNDEIRTKYNLDKKYVLGVASIWSKRKGLDDFIKLRKILDLKIEIVLVGLSPEQIESLPADIRGISRTKNNEELASIYTMAEALINPTHIDNFPTVNLEALACGTPVVTYNTGGSPESVNAFTGFIVEKGDIPGLLSSVSKILEKGKAYYLPYCIGKAKESFGKNHQVNGYVNIYQSLLT